MKKKFFFAVMAIVALASCADNEFVGENNNSPNPENASEAIVFTSGARTATRADYYGQAAADKLHNKFIVGGFKGAKGTSTGEDSEHNPIVGVPATGLVFDNYQVVWKTNSAGTTQSNTSDWEYVGTMADGTSPINALAPSGLAGNAQTIKYWDYSADQYDFIAYSTGNATVITAGDPTGAQVLVSAINAGNAGKAASGAYTLKGGVDALKECYIADMVTVYKDGKDPKYKYREEVPFVFRSLISKVRIALYETIPGYSVKDVRFYTDATTNLAVPTNATGDALTASKKATLFTTGTDAKDNFFTSGEYKVYFPTIGYDNVGTSDYNKAHVVFDKTNGSKQTTMDFSTLNYGAAQAHESSTGSIWLGRNSKQPTFAGALADNYYKIVLPNEEGAVLELRIDYTLESIDGSGEEIHVYGATAYVPAIYATWKPNYAYTYLFKISDNTNGWTHETASASNPTDPAGLYPITFDAIVLETEDNTQSTITTVATPSITTYQKGHNYSTDGPEYKASAETDEAIFVQVMHEGTTAWEPATDLATKGQLYTVTDPDDKITEADVMDALNLPESSTTTGTPAVTTITGRNGWVLVTATSNAAVEAIPGADGNDITVTAGTAASFAATAGTYAYVYDTGTYGGDYYPTKPADWGTANDNSIYYTNALCTTLASTFTAGTYYRKSSTIRTYVTLSSDPGDWSGSVYFTDEACTIPVTGDYAAGSYYKKYTVNNKIYGVKVIRVK